jgi:4-amino-4-deoxy-L-arabinose transferase-like glycosyltransferase
VTTAAVEAVSGRATERERTGDPAWARPALGALLLGTGLLYLVGLGASGYANSFYSAAVQAATQSWKAFFFGSFDASNFITVDKPPASLWIMDFSARLFGVNAWSILVPQALEGVAAVGLLYATVRRRFGAGAGLLAGAVLALTPVATLMFRFDNPDALLTLLLVASAYALTRALEHASSRWLVLAGALVGLAFLAKMLQALTVVPGFAVVYLLAAPTSLGRRVRQLLGSGAALVAAAGSWVAIVELWPAGSRPYIGGSQRNSVLELVFGYNGFGRITGDESGSVVGGGGPGGAGAWGPTGITRLFGAEMGTQISWLLPAALLTAGLLLWTSRRAPRTDGRRAEVLLWSSWLVVTGLVFSFAQGIIHPYYTVALAPAIGALVGIGGAYAWHKRASFGVRVAVALTVAASVVWAHHLLVRTPGWQPWLRTGVLVAGLAAAGGLLVPPARLPRRRAAEVVTACTLVAAALAAPAAYSIETASTPHTGAIPAAGPAGASSSGGFGRPGGARAFRGGAAPAPPGGGLFAAPGAGGGAPAFGGGARPRGGGLGGLLDASTPNAALVRLLQSGASGYRWAAATVGANSAAGVQLASGEPIMAIGGFNGTDPTPSLAQFEADVAAGRVHYFLAGGARGFAGGRGTSSAIASWVEQHFTSTTVGGVMVYDLSTTSGAAGSAWGGR